MRPDQEIDKSSGEPRQTWPSFVAGGIAGILSKTVVAPLDRAKILFQTRPDQIPAHANRTIPLLFHIHRTEGFRSLFAGNLSTVIRIGPYAAVSFSAFEHFKDLFDARDPRKHPFRAIAAGTCAGACAVISTYPLDVLRTRLAYETASSSSFSSSPSAVMAEISSSHPATNSASRNMLAIRGGRRMADMARSMWASGGHRPWFAGLSTTLIGIVPYAGANFFTNDWLKAHASAFLSERAAVDSTNGDASESFPVKLPVWVRMVCGGFAGATGQAVAYPLDVVRRIQQVRPGTPFGAVVHEIWTRNGIRGFYRGITINFAKVVPMVSVSFTTYDIVRSWLAE